MKFIYKSRYYEVAFYLIKNWKKKGT